MIRIDKDYRIEVDSYGYILIKKKVTDEINVKTGKPITQQSRWYHPDLKSSLKRYCKEVIRPCQSIEEVIERIEQLEQLIDDKFK